MNATVAVPKRVGAVNLETEQWEALEALAARHDRPKSYFVRQAVTAFLEQMAQAKGAEVAR